MKTVVFNGMATNAKRTLKFGKYVFTFDSKLKPIPVLVPSDIAELLLQMTASVSKCCRQKPPKKLFLEVE
jgi:hypothetical protein